MYVNCALHSVTLYSQQMGGRKRLNVRQPLAATPLACLVLCATVQTGRRRWKKKARRSRAVRFAAPHWGLTSRRKFRIGQTKLCHFFKRLSRYCFFNCNRCSFMSNNGHLLIFNATFIFSHRSNNTFSIAAKSFMVLSRKDVLLICCRLHVLQP